MKQFLRNTLVVIVMVCLATQVRAGVYIDDSWSDTTRTDPATYSENGTDFDADGDIESAWFTSSAAALSAAGHNLTLTMSSSAIQSLTYFTSNSVGPAHLDLGDTLVATLHITFSSLAASPSSAGFRIGVFDFADSTLSPKRVANDASITSNNSLGNGVQGYSLFQTMGTTFSSTSPMDVRKRTGLADSALLGTSGDWTSLATGPGNTNGFGGFVNGVNYTLQISLQRSTLTSMVVTVSWLNPTNSATLTTTATDTSAVNTNFDAIALRPANAAGSATTITFTEARVELIPGATSPAVGIDPQDQDIFQGQDASFSVVAAGTTPLYYLWYYTNSPLNTATNASLVVTNAQVGDAGGYSVVVSNAYGSVTSAVAQLTVSIPDPPSITTQPQDQINVTPGSTVAFTVSAGGSEPLNYQWYYNTSNLLAGATSPALTITNVQLASAGSYSVTVSNIAGSATSSNAMLTVDTSPVAPAFINQPASQVVVSGNTVTFSATASGTTPIDYQWYKNGSLIPAATLSSLPLINVQTTDGGSYSLVASNSVGTATSSNAQLTVTAAIPIINSAYNLTGFGNATRGGGIIPDTDPAYRKCFTPLDFVRAISNSTKTANAVKVIEVMNDLDLGFTEVGATVQGVGPLRAAKPVLLHPRLMVTGVSIIDIQAKSPLTIFSANGSTIRHAKLNVKGTSNIMIRNLKFDEMWEWDEDSKGAYDGNDWDFITLGDGGGTVSNVWIDHCTFTKAYDGIVDIKGGANHLTFSWCKYTGDDGATNPNSFVWQQINALESNKSSYAMYNSLRTFSGLSATDIVTIIQGHDKTHLMGANSGDTENNNLSATFHHQWFINPWDRCVPRLRAGNVHDYNIFVDDTLAYAAKQFLTNHVVDSRYSFNPPLNGSISTENGALLVEKSVYLNCLWPLRDNQTDVTQTQYTGKILALDTTYLNPRDNSLTPHGNSTDPGSQLGPFQAITHLPFSWNLPGNQLPYTYTMDDPDQLQAIVTSPTGGAGAGVLTWNKTNWLATSYAPSAPIIYGDPQSQTVAPNNNATFTVAAVGSDTLFYQWFFNTSSAIANATNSTLTLASVQSTNAGTYSVLVSNSTGTATSALATLGVTTPLTAFQQWQQSHFGCTNNCPGSAATDDPDGDGMNNQAEFLAGTDPNNGASGLRIISVQPQGSNVAITWTTGGGSTNVVQATLGDGTGGYATNFGDISGPIPIPGSGDVTTNYTDVGGATNMPARFYRIRLGP